MRPATNRRPASGTRFGAAACDIVQPVRVARQLRATPTHAAGA